MLPGGANSTSLADLAITASTAAWAAIPDRSVCYRSRLNDRIIRRETERNLGDTVTPPNQPLEGGHCLF